MAELERLAIDLLHRCGADVTTITRGPGWSNATWVTDQVVVRIEVASSGDDLAREVQLVQRLVPGAGHPEVVASGTGRAHAWMVTRRVPGANLGGSGRR